MGENIDEGKIKGAIDSIDLENIAKICEQMKTSICKIIGDTKGTGFFCKILKDIPVLITNYHVISDKFINENNHIKIFIDDDKIFKIIKSTEKSKIYSSPNDKYDIKIIKLNDEEKYNYLELDDFLFNENSEEFYEEKSIYILHYPSGNRASVSFGYGIKKIVEDEYYIKHLCNTETCSSGSPILNLSTNKVIGIHKGQHKNSKSITLYNLGIFLKYPLNEIYMEEVNYEKKEINHKHKDIIEGNINPTLEKSINSTDLIITKDIINDILIYYLEDINVEKPANTINDIILKEIIKDCNNNIDKINKIIDNLFNKYQNETGKIHQLINFISYIILINDTNSLRRYIEFLGYPTLYIIPIPKENKKNQKWPLFGERLINGDINQEIYEYIIPDHNKNHLCLLSILFPSKYHPDRKIKIKEEQKRKILINFIKCIYDDRNNYSLFKYLYTMPSRSLKYFNLYDEIIEYLDINNNPPINLYVMKNKEIKYKTQVEEELKNNITNVIKKDNNESKYENFYKFNYENLNIESFNGFIGQIIPGEIMREEIYGLAKTNNMAIYRIHYYTKYYKLKDLREKLLNNKKIKEKEEKEGISEQEIISELDELPNIIKYDISEMTEDLIIYNIYKNKNNKFIIEDKARKNENNVKNTLIRFIFTNKGKKGIKFNANVNHHLTKNESILNLFHPKKIYENVDGYDHKTFMILHRLRDDLNFMKNEISIEIDLGN